MNNITSRLALGCVLTISVGFFIRAFLIMKPQTMKNIPVPPPVQHSIAGIPSAFLDVPIGHRAPAAVNVIVEIPRGTINRFEYDEHLGMLRLQGVVISGTEYPGDFGIIPRTKGENGQALDALILLSEPTYPGTLVEARPIGVLHMTDNGVRTDKIVLVPLFDSRYNGVTNIDNLPDFVRDEVAEFFRTYLNEQQEWVKVEDWGRAEEARAVILAGMERYLQ